MTTKEVRPFWGEGWAEKALPGGRCEITVPLTHVNMIESTGQLLVKTGLAFEAGDVIKIGEIEALIKERETAWDYPFHTWLLTVECERASELRGMLTYQWVI